jgi:hypothetical protein
MELGHDMCKMAFIILSLLRFYFLIEKKIKEKKLVQIWNTLL